MASFIRGYGLVKSGLFRVPTRCYSKKNDFLTSPPSQLPSPEEKGWDSFVENAKRFQKQPPITLGGIEKVNLCSQTNITSLEPGLVHIKDCLSLVEQVKLSHLALQQGKKTSGGFWGNDQKLNCTENRGRIFNAVDAFPKEFLQTCMSTLKLAHGVDRNLKVIKPTHLIMLYYKTLATAPHIPWHQDNGENDGKENLPVVSLSLGDSCDFLICHKKPLITRGYSLSKPKNLAYRLTLHSGDALIFGGDCRHIWHAIYDIHPNTAPKELPFDGARINFTFRYAPEILGKEDNFSIIDPNIGKDNQFFKLSKMK